MSLIGSTSFGFAQNTMHDFQNTVFNSYWHCLQQMPQKKTPKFQTVSKIQLFGKEYILTTWQGVKSHRCAEGGQKDWIILYGIKGLVLVALSPEVRICPGELGLKCQVTYPTH